MTNVSLFSSGFCVVFIPYLKLDIHLSNLKHKQSLKRINVTVVVLLVHNLEV